MYVIASFVLNYPYDAIGKRICESELITTSIINKITKYKVYSTETGKTSQLDQQQMKKLAATGKVQNAKLITDLKELCRLQRLINLNLFNTRPSDYDETEDELHKLINSRLPEGEPKSLYKVSNLIIDNILATPYAIECTFDGNKTPTRTWRNKEHTTIIGYTEECLVVINSLGRKELISYEDIENKAASVDKFTNFEFITGNRKNIDIDKFKFEIEKAFKPIVINDSDIEKIEQHKKVTTILSVAADSEYYVGLNGVLVITGHPSSIVCKECKSIKLSDYCAYDKCNTFIVKSGLKKVEDIFTEPSALESFILPPNVEKIGYNCFSHTRLKKIDLRPYKKLRTLSPNSFSSNMSLIELYYPDNVRTLSSCGYENPKLTTILLPKYCTTLYISSLQGNSSLIRLGLPETKCELRGTVGYLLNECKESLKNLSEIYTNEVNIPLAKKITNCCKYPNRVKIIVQKRV